MNRGFGKYGSFLNEERSEGSFGFRKTVWAIKLDDYNHYCFMTSEENQIFDDMVLEYANRLKEIAILTMQWKNGLLTDKEYAEAVGSKMNFLKM